MKKIGKIILFSLFWAVIIAAMVLLGRYSSQQHQGKMLTGLDIVLADSSDHALVNEATVRQWLSNAAISVENVRVADAPLGQIEQAILSHGFVRSAEAYLTPEGRVVVEIDQHNPIMRMRLDGGYDFYITDRNEIFRSPEMAAIYVPIVTGRFAVPFSANYEGEADVQLNENLKVLDAQIDTLHEAENELSIQYRHIRRQRRSLNASSLDKRPFESDESYKARKAPFDKMRKDSLALYLYRMRERQKMIDQTRIDVERLKNKQKNLQKNYEDFINLINFVKLIEDDDFWQAQIVEIVVSQSQNGSLFLRLIPRAGSHTIIFGRIEDVEVKLDRLMRFYREGLDKEGWDRFRTIDVRFADRVVCSK